MLSTLEIADELRAFDDLNLHVNKLDEMIQLAGTLKSVEDGILWIEELKKSINHISSLKNHLNTYLHVASTQDGQTVFKDRILVRKGVDYQSLRVEDVAFIFTENKLVFVVDKDGKKFLAHANNLCDLMLQLNKRIFYRANRKYIININYIKKYRPFERVKVEVELALQTPEFVVISQENASGFKHWIENL